MTYRPTLDLAPWQRSRLQNRVFVFVKNDGVSITAPSYGGSVTRATIALQFNHATSKYTQVASGVDRAQHDVYSSGLGAWQLNGRLAGDPQRTNSALNSCRPDLWTNASTLGIAGTAVSCIPGQTAYVITNVSSTTAALTQVIGTFGTAGQTDAPSIILEQGTAGKTTLAVYDATAGAYLGTVVLTWAGLGLATTGTVQAKFADVHGIGPNGGAMVKLWLTTTSVAASPTAPGGAGNSRRLDWIPSGGVSDTATTIFHYAGLEANAPFPSTPIVTTSATATRNAEVVNVPLPAAAQSAQALCAYEKYVDQGLALELDAGARWLLGVSSGALPRLIGSMGNPSQPLLRLSNNIDATVYSNPPAVSAVPGDTVEVRDILLSSGALQTGAAKNGGAETLAAASAAPAHGIIVPWSDNTIYLGSRAVSAVGMSVLFSFVLAAGAPSMPQFRGFT